MGPRGRWGLQVPTHTSSVMASSVARKVSTGWEARPTPCLPLPHSGQGCRSPTPQQGGEPPTPQQGCGPPLLSWGPCLRAVDASVGLRCLPRPGQQRQSSGTRTGWLSLLGLPDHPPCSRRPGQLPPAQRVLGVLAGRAGGGGGSFWAEAVLGGGRGALWGSLTWSRGGAPSNLRTEPPQRWSRRIVLRVREFPKKGHGEEGSHLPLLSHRGALRVRGPRPPGSRMRLCG